MSLLALWIASDSRYYPLYKYSAAVSFAHKLMAKNDGEFCTQLVNLSLSCMKESQQERPSIQDILDLPLFQLDSGTSSYEKLPLMK